MNSTAMKDKKQNIKDIKLKNKRGVTLVALAIMIVIMVILASAAVVSVVSISNNSKIVSFATDLSNIEQAVESYYLENNDLPKVSVPIEYTKNSTNSLSALAGTNGSKLESEIDLNQDMGDKFFEIDLSKIKINSSVRGLKANGENDIYVVNDRNLRVYYVKGYQIGTDTYFSLTEKLIKSSNIQRPSLNTNALSVTTETDGIKLTKNKKDYTNSLNISVSSGLETGQKLRYIVAGTTAIDISGNNLEMKLNVTTMTAITNSVTNFTNISSPIKTFVVEKVVTSTGVVIAKASMDISNLDIQSPVIDITSGGSTSFASFSDFNTLTLNTELDLGGAGIKEIRYEYTTKLNVNGWLESYFTPPITVDSTYLLGMGKVAKGNIIKLDKHIKSVRMVCIDNAGNVSDVKTYSVAIGNVSREVLAIKSLLPEVAAYKTRVIAGGGEVIYASSLNDTVTFLKNKNMYNNLVLYISTLGGIKKNFVTPTNYVQTAYDLIGNDAVQVTSTSQPVYTDLGIQFDGTGRYLETASTTSLNPGLSDFTLVAWLKTTNTGGAYKRIIDKGYTSAYAVFINNGFIGMAIAGLYTNNLNGTNLNDDTWHQIAVVFNRSSNAVYYVDGLANGTPSNISSKVSTNLTNTTNFWIGYGTTADGKFSGLINDVGFFNKALTANDILNLYNQTKGKYIVVE